MYRRNDLMRRAFGWLSVAGAVLLTLIVSASFALLAQQPWEEMLPFASAHIVGHAVAAMIFLRIPSVSAYCSAYRK